MELKAGFHALFAVVVAAGSVAAQSQTAHLQRGESQQAQAEFIEERLAKSRHQLDQNESTLHRLHELRLRLAFGLATNAERYFTLDANQRELASNDGRARLTTEQGELQRLSNIASTLQEQCDLARRGLASRSVQMTTANASESIATSTAGVGVTPDRGSAGSLADWAWEGAPTTETSGDPEVPGVTSRPSVATADSMPTSKPHGMGAPAESMGERVPADKSRVITGSSDRSAVARMLLRSGESTLRRAVRIGDDTSAQAKSLHQQGRELLESAKREFEAILESAGDEPPALIDLYHLARCEEKLGNVPVADSHYAEIISRDRSISAEGIEIYGRWGRAAQAAKSVLRWVSDTGGWQPDIDSIDWNGQ